MRTRAILQTYPLTRLDLRRIIGPSGHERQIVA